MFARNVLIKAFKSPQVRRRGVSTIAFVKTHKPIIGLSAVAVAVVLLAPPREFDDLDCQSYLFNELDDPDHPFHYYPNVHKSETHIE